MADDKDNATPDPWANIESGDATEGGEGFSFSLDGLEADASAPDLDLGEGFSFSADEPAAAPGEEPVFSLDADAGVEELQMHDESAIEAAGAAIEEAGAAIEPLAAGFGGDEPVDVVADEMAKDLAGDDQAFAAEDIVGEWLSEAQPAVADEPLLSADSSDDPFSFVAADREPEADAGGADVSLVGGASSIDIGTGQSGITSESDIIPASEASEEGFPGLDFGGPQEVEAAAAGDDEGGFGIESLAEEEPAAAWPGPADEEPAVEQEAADAFGFAEASDAVETLAVGAAAAGAVTAAAAPKKTARTTAKSKPQKQGGLGQMIGVVVGGLMALPITYAILIWGFQKDPFKLTKSLPEEVAFLLPAKFQPGGRTASGPKLQGGPSLDDLAKIPSPDMPVEPPAADDAAGDALPKEPGIDAPPSGEEPAALDASAPEEVKPEEEKPDEPLVAPPPPVEPPAPPPLDLSGLEAAVEAAEASLTKVAGIDPSASGAQKKVLVAWYKHLANVGEELAVLETVAADTGRPLEDVPDVVKTLYGKMAGEEGVVDHLKRLCRDWVNFRKRPADGVMLVASFDESRKVGPYWSSTVSLEQGDGSTKQVSVISRSEPKARAGDRVVVTGVVFEDDVVWAADCRSLEAGPAKAVDDLF